MKERLFRNRTAVFTVVFVLLVGLVGILAPVIAPNDPYETNILNKFASYSLQYPLGTDQLGRCVLSRMIYGIRPTLGLALLTMFGTISLGAILGIMAGYFRGIVEEVIMRVVDVMLSFPSQIMVFAVVALLGVSVQNVIIAYEESARVARNGKEACIKYGHYQVLHSCLEIEAECDFFLGKKEESAERYREAFYICKVMRYEDDLQIIRNEAQKYLDIIF